MTSMNIDDRFQNLMEKLGPADNRIEVTFYLCCKDHRYIKVSGRCDPYKIEEQVAGAGSWFQEFSPTAAYAVWGPNNSEVRRVKVSFNCLGKQGINYDELTLAIVSAHELSSTSDLRRMGYAYRVFS